MPVQAISPHPVEPGGTVTTDCGCLFLSGHSISSNTGGIHVGQTFDDLGPRLMAAQSWHQAQHQDVIIDSPCQMLQWCGIIVNPCQILQLVCHLHVGMVASAPSSSLLAAALCQ